MRQPFPSVRALCEAVAALLSKNMTRARPGYNANTFLTLHIALFTPHTPHFTLALHLNSSHLSSFHLIPCLPICQLSSSWLFSCQVPVLMSTTKACKNHFPVLLCTTKLAQNTFQYYFVLQSLHKALPSTTLYYKACTKHFPVLLCTTKLAQNTFQYYFVLQSLHKAVPSTTLYYKACTKHFPVLLCTTKLGQRRRKLQLQNPISTPKRQKDDFEALFKRNFTRKITSAKIKRKSADKSLSQPGCSHSNTIYNLQLQKTIVLRMQPRHQATLTQAFQCNLQRLSCKTQ